MRRDTPSYTCLSIVLNQIFPTKMFECVLYMIDVPSTYDEIHRSNTASCSIVSIVR